MSASSVSVLIGTQTGNAELVAEEIAGALEAMGVAAELVDMYDAVPEEMEEVSNLVVCTSTWGEGELPDNAVDFYEGLDTYRPDLSGLTYGLVALGDHYYDPHFCAAGRMFETLLEGLGATRATDSLDLNEGPTDDDLEHVRQWTHTYAMSLPARVLASS